MSTGTHTPVSISDMYNAMKAAWQGVIGETPTDTALLSVMAQWALETGNGASMYNYNVGNFKSAGGNGSPPGAYFTIPTHETINGVYQVVQANFASYDSLQAGVGAYLSALHSRFSGSWPDIEDGDMQAFAQDLYDQGYYTGQPPDPVGTYAAGLVARRALVASSLGLSVPSSGSSDNSGDDNA
jgi:hypothetical protein